MQGGAAASLRPTCRAAMVGPTLCKRSMAARTMPTATGCRPGSADTHG